MTPGRTSDKRIFGMASKLAATLLIFAQETSVASLVPAKVLERILAPCDKVLLLARGLLGLALEWTSCAQLNICAGGSCGRYSARR